jgi:hypothetical protein
MYPITKQGEQLCMTHMEVRMPENIARPGQTRSRIGQPLVPEDKIDGDMHSEEPLGWDQAPTDIHEGPAAPGRRCEAGGKNTRACSHAEAQRRVRPQ